jgi:hypothetical protein
MEYCRSMIGWYYPHLRVDSNFQSILDNEKEFDRLPIIRWGESPEQWKSRVEFSYALVSRENYSVYHRFCLFAGFGKGKFDVDYWEYERPKIHNNNMAICFRCKKLFQVDDVKPKDSYHYSWRQRLK